MMGKYLSDSSLCQSAPVCSGRVSWKGAGQIDAVPANPSGAQHGVQQAALRAGQQLLAILRLRLLNHDHQFCAGEPARRDPFAQAAVVQQRLIEPPGRKRSKVLRKRSAIYARQGRCSFLLLPRSAACRRWMLFCLRFGSGKPCARLIEKIAINPRLAPPVERGGKVGEKIRVCGLIHRVGLDLPRSSNQGTSLIKRAADATTFRGTR